MEVLRGKELILIHEHALLRNCLIIVVFAIFVSWGRERRSQKYLGLYSISHAFLLSSKSEEFDFFFPPLFAIRAQTCSFLSLKARLS